MKRCDCQPPLPPPQKGPSQYTPSKLYPFAGNPRQNGSGPWVTPCGPGPVPPAPPRQRPVPPKPIPEHDDARSWMKGVAIEGEGNIIVDKFDETYRTRYVVRYEGFDERYQLVPYTEEELAAICDPIDNKETVEG